MAAKQIASRVKVEMLFDVISPYTYIQLELLLRNRQNWPRMQLELKPIFFSGIIAGSKNVPPFMCKKKDAYCRQDLQMVSELFKIPLKIPDQFFEKALSKYSLPAQRFLTAVQPQISADSFHNFVRHLFRSHFSQDSCELNNPQILLNLAVESGVDKAVAKTAIQQLESDETKNRLRFFTEEALERGVFGIPTMFVHTKDGPKMVWGSDRMFLIQHLMGEKNAPLFCEE